MDRIYNAIFRVHLLDMSLLHNNGKTYDILKILKKTKKHRKKKLALTGYHAPIFWSQADGMAAGKIC